LRFPVLRPENHCETSVLKNDLNFGELPAAWPARLSRLAWAVLMAVLAAGWLGGHPVWAQDAPTDPLVAGNDSLQGVVLNSVTHEPVSRALVSSPDNRFATMTDGQGHFEFKIPKATNDAANRPTALMARKPGYLTELVPDMDLDRSVKEVTLSLAPEGLIAGHVSLPSAEAADKIQVELFRREVEYGRAHWVPGGQTATRSNGDFRFAELAAGTYKVMTLEQLDHDHPPATSGGEQLYGYAPVYFPSSKTFAGGETIALSAGQTFQADLMVVRQPYFPVKVSVTNAPPNGGIGVSVSSAGSHGPGYSLGYNSQTHLIEGMLPQGTYLVEGFGFGPPFRVGESALTVHNAPLSVGSMTMVATQSITVNVKEEFSSQEQTNDANSVTVTRLSSASTGPRSYLSLRLEPVDDFIQHGGVSLRPPTNAKDESLVLDGVVPSRYWVHVDSWRGYASSVTSGGVDLLTEPLVVAGGSTGPIEITMRDDTAQVEGTIEGADLPTSSGSRAPSAHVYCVPLPDSPGRFAEVAASPDGTFTFLNLPPGVYRVLAFKHAQPSLEFRNPEVIRAYETSGPVVHLTSGGKDHITVPLISKGE
jgi:hypothetical protein